MLKHEIKNLLIKFLVDEEILDPSALSSILITQTDLQLRELEVQRQIQMEKLRLEQEERKLEREERIRVEQLEREERMQKDDDDELKFNYASTHGVILRLEGYTAL